MSCSINYLRNALAFRIGAICLLSNWREFVSSRRTGVFSPLRFRRGFILHHGPGDDPLLLMNEVFMERTYSRNLPGKLCGHIVDIGANIGSVVLDMASRYPGSIIHAYEPTPSTCQMLTNNVMKNHLEGHVVIYEEAVGRHAGDLELAIGRRSVLTTAYGAALHAPDIAVTRVKMVDLNEVVARVDGPVALLKIDAEGAEADILEGARPDALGSVERVRLEYHRDLCRDALGRCRSVLERAGFRITVIDEGGSAGIIYADRTKTVL